MDWADWLGGNFIVWRSFSDARIYVRALDLKNQKEWFLWARGEHQNVTTLKPTDIPITPNTVYGTQWIGMWDWLGTEKPKNVKPNWRSFGEAKKFVHTLGFKMVKEYRQWANGLLNEKDSHFQTICQSIRMKHIKIKAG